MAITNARMQIKRGNESEFDPEKMLPGEWALSIDKKIVRICVAPNVCIRIATYDAFEVDMAQIEKILEECQTIEEAVKLINSEVSDKLNAVIEYTNQAKQYCDEAKKFRDEAEQFAPDGYVELQETVASNTAKIDTIIEKAELNIKNSASGENIHLTDSANSKVVEFGLYGKAEQFVGTITDDEGNEISVPNPDYPQEITVSGSDGSVEVVSCGKNLLKNTATTQTVNGVTFTVNEDGSVKLAETCTGSELVYLNNNILLEDGSYLASIGENIRLRILGYSSSWVELGNSSNGLVAFNAVSETYSKYMLQVGIESGKTYNTTIYPMIRLASDTDDTYEPYTETTSTIPTPDGLCGIKVSSGGNYTDENGQQWICDEVVKYADGSGKRIQRISKKTISNITGVTDIFTDTVRCYNSGVIADRKSGVSINAMCDKFIFSNNNIKEHMQFNPGEQYKSYLYIYVNKSRVSVSEETKEEYLTALKTLFAEKAPMVYYELAEPIITDLSAEEIAEIEKLHTFYPVTNISNDADCGMSITYKADAKNYIDNRLALIESAMLNNI